MEQILSEKLDSIVSRIIQISNPAKIILFGSSARGDMTEDSDFDILVITKNRTHRRKTARQIYRSISDVGFASDIIVVTEEDVEIHKNDEASIISTALKEGKILYTA